MRGFRAKRPAWLMLAVMSLAAVTAAAAPARRGARARAGGAPQTYIGFDRNDYPGDDLLPSLRRTFAFIGYWLNTPPGDTVNTWAGKRPLLRAGGFGFVLLFNGRLNKDLETARIPASELGTADGKLASGAARREGFPPRAVIFLDQEEGGGLLPKQAAYLFAWAAEVRRAGYRAGVYCSGIRVPDAKHGVISTALDIERRPQGRRIALWVANDECPRSPGCSVAKRGLAPGQSGVARALVWQYAQSPKRSTFASGCRGYDAADNRCYAPGVPHTRQGHVDLNSSRLADPSGGR